MKRTRKALTSVVTSVWTTVNLVCNGNQVQQCIQVSYDISSEKTRKRELKGLKTAAQIIGCKNLLLLTDHEYEDTTFEGFDILIRPVHEWQ